MDIVTYSEARNNLKSVLDKVVADSMPTVIFRQRGQSVVVMSKSDYDSMTETNYLMSNPANATRLREGMAEMDAGKGIVVDPKTLGKS
ncbi:MAG: type II toxin-antitoxin system prevent-host-death family antitoxin [Novosphingobium sp.]